MNSKGLTEDEKVIFKKELIEFMEERKCLNFEDRIGCYTFR